MLCNQSQHFQSQKNCTLNFQFVEFQNIVYAYDIAFATQKLWEPFTADNSPTLGGKPKLFFFQVFLDQLINETNIFRVITSINLLQACQGTNMDEGVQVHETETDGGFASYKVPIHSDFLVAHSTVDGFYSWRNTAQGSWYIQVI